MTSILNKFVGNQRLFSNSVALALEKSFPPFAVANNVTNAAPAWKWVLSIVPLTQAISGNPTVDKIDAAQSASLVFTGVVWAYYATIIKPQNYGSRALCACNLALLTVNGYNLYRRLKYDSEQAAKSA